MLALVLSVAIVAIMIAKAVNLNGKLNNGNA